MARPELVEFYKLLLRQATRSGSYLLAARQGLELSLPGVEQDDGTVPDHHLVLVSIELWLLVDSFRLRDRSELLDHPCCDKTKRLLSTPARCETVPFCTRCA